MSTDPLEAGVPQSEIPRLYGRLAGVYDAWAALTEGRPRRRALELAAVADGEDVLEIAVGTGLAFRAIVRANPHGRNEGIDLTEAMLARARAKIAQLPGRNRLCVGDAHRLEFADGAFDLVFSAYMFDLLPSADFVPVLREMRRVLRSRGRLVLLDLAPPPALAGRLFAAIYRWNPRLIGGCRGIALAPAVAAASFADVRTEDVRQLGFPSQIVTARRDARA